MTYQETIQKCANKIKEMQADGINIGSKIILAVNQILITELGITESECGNHNSGPFADVLLAWVSRDK